MLLSVGKTNHIFHFSFFIFHFSFIIYHLKNLDLTFRTYYRPLCLYAMHYLDDTQTVEDVVQDVFVRMLQTDEQPQNVRAWLYTAVRNRCIDLLRRRSPLVADIQPTDLEGIISDEEAQERSQREAELWTRIDALPTRSREVLLMAKRDGMKYAEIAEVLGISTKTVEHHISKALKSLREDLDKAFSFLFLLP